VLWRGRYGAPLDAIGFTPEASLWRRDGHRLTRAPQVGARAPASGPRQLSLDRAPAGAVDCHEEFPAVHRTTARLDGDRLESRLPFDAASR
jgi:hypothetical protein